VDTPKTRISLQIAYYGARVLLPESFLGVAPSAAASSALSPTPYCLKPVEHCAAELSFASICLLVDVTSYVRPSGAQTANQK